MRTLQNHYLEMVDPSEVVVVVLGGGRGRGLHPLTRDRAKAAVGFGGKYRLVDICFTNCLRSKLERIFLLSYVDSFSLNRHIWQTYGGVVSPPGFVDLVTAAAPAGSDELQSAVEALRQARAHIFHHAPKYVLLLHGDQIYEMDYRKLLLWHEIHEAEITVVGHYIPEEEIGDRTLIRLDANQRALEFYPRPRRADRIEAFRLGREGPLKRPEGKEYMALVGAALVSAGTFRELLEAQTSGGLEEGLLAAGAARGRMAVYPFDGYWEDVGSIAAFFRANMAWREGGGAASLFRGAESVVTPPGSLSPTRIEGALIEESFVADGSEIAARRVTRSLVGMRSRIGSDTILEDCILMGNDAEGAGAQGRVGRGCCLQQAIVDKNACIGNNVRILPRKGREDADEELYTIRSGIVVIPRGARVPDGTVI